MKLEEYLLEAANDGPQNAKHKNAARRLREDGYRIVKLETMYGGPEQRYTITEELT